MKYIRFNNRYDQLHWNREFARKGGVTMFRGGVYLFSEEQLQAVQDASMEYEEIDRDEVSQLLRDHMPGAR